MRPPLLNTCELTSSDQSRVIGLRSCAANGFVFLFQNVLSW